MRRWIGIALALFGFAAAANLANACTAGGCVQAGPRLASVSSSQGVLLNAVLSALGGGTVNLTVGDWNSIATGTVSLSAFVNALQTQTAASTPANALNTNVSLVEAINVTANAATQDGNPTLAAALGTLASSFNLVPG